MTCAADDGPQHWLTARQARDDAIAKAKNAELSKAVRNRSYFTVEDIAKRLARPPGLSKPDADERDCLIQILLERASRGELLDEAGQIGAYRLSGEAPFFVPIEVPPPALDAVMRILTLDPAETFLSRSSVRRLLCESSLGGASRLLQELFTGFEPSSPEVVQPPLANAPVRRGSHGPVPEK